MHWLLWCICVLYCLVLCQMYLLAYGLLTYPMLVINVSWTHAHQMKGITIPGISSPSMLCYIADRSKRLMRRVRHFVFTLSSRRHCSNYNNKLVFVLFIYLFKFTACIYITMFNFTINFAYCNQLGNLLVDLCRMCVLMCLAVLTIDIIFLVWM